MILATSLNISTSNSPVCEILLVWRAGPRRIFLGQRRIILAREGLRRPEKMRVDASRREKTRADARRREQMREDASNVIWGCFCLLRRCRHHHREASRSRCHWTSDDVAFEFAVGGDFEAAVEEWDESSSAFTVVVVVVVVVDVVAFAPSLILVASVFEVVRDATYSGLAGAGR